MIAIVDYNMGNLGSIRNMLRKLGFDATITRDPKEIAAAGKIILPGVGAFDAGMKNLHESGLVPLLTERILGAGVPALGICLGMQLMTERSAEGERPGLGWIPGEVVRIRSDDAPLKVPHMGWNVATPVRPDPLVDELPDEARFYFVHSYRVACRDEADVLLRTRYGEEFDSAFQKGNVRGVQFHPEKSHRFGMHLLRNFAERC